MGVGVPAAVEGDVGIGLFYALAEVYEGLLVVVLFASILQVGPIAFFEENADGEAVVVAEGKEVG